MKIKKRDKTRPLFTGKGWQKYRKLFLAKPGAAETFPFGPQVAVYKIKGKMFATFSPDQGVWYANLKCDPHWAETLRKQYAAIQPGYHMNKKHWNTVTLDDSIPERLIRRMVDLSYALAAPAK